MAVASVEAPSKKTHKPKVKGDFRLLLGFVKKYKKFAILTPLIVSIEAIIEVLIPTFMSRLIDEGIGHYAIDPNTGLPTDAFINGEIKYVLIWGAVMIGCAVISLIAGYFAARFAVTASQGFAKNLRKAQFEKIQDFSFANTDKFSTASLITRMTTDVTNTAASFQMCIRMMVRAPIMLIFASVMAFRMNAELAQVFLIAMPVLLISLIVIMFLAYPNFRKMLTKFDSMNASVQENLIGIRVVKAFVRKDFEVGKFEKTSKEVRQSQIKAEKIVSFGSPIMQLVMYGCFVGIAFVGGINVLQGTHGMRYSDLTSFISYTTQILMSLMMISMFFVNFVLSRASMKRIAEVLREEPDIKDNPDAKRSELEDSSIRFDHVGFSYAKREDNLVLEDIDLTINSGETVGIIGGTGSSKTTLVQLIPRLYDVTRGEVIVGQHNVKEYRLKTLRDQVAMVLQKNVLFSGTIKDNLRWGNMNATDEEIVEACKQAEAHDFIMSFPNGYDTDLGQGGVNVSGGQKQRLCIARALLKKPKIIILDDSTSAVDTATDAKIRHAFRQNLQGTTTIIIAQRISSIQDADKIIVLDDGKIAAMGKHEELMKTSDIYREVYTSQMKGAEA